MKILLIGYGKMGQLIEKEAERLGHQVVKIIDVGDEWPTFDKVNNPDIAIEFTEPGSVFDNICKCQQAGIPMVTGTTGWYSQLDEARELCESNDCALLYASNFSIGVNIWFDLIADAARRFSSLQDYLPSLHEKHHEHKKDAPSGTAVIAAETFLKNSDGFSGWSLDKKENSLFIEAIREGEVKGFHELRYQSSFDRIRISHEAFSRDGFVQGAVKAAEWMAGKTGFYDFHDVYFKVFNLNNISE